MNLLKSVASVWAASSLLIFHMLSPINAGPTSEPTPKNLQGRINDTLTRGSLWLQKEIEQDLSDTRTVTHMRNEYWLQGYALALYQRAPDNPVLFSILPSPKELERESSFNLSLAILFLSALLDPATEKPEAKTEPDETSTIRKLLQKSVEALLSRQGSGGGFHNVDRKNPDGCPGVQSYELIALAAAIDVGVSIPKSTWKKSFEFAESVVERQLQKTPGRVSIGADLELCRRQLNPGAPYTKSTARLLENSRIFYEEFIRCFEDSSSNRNILISAPWSLLFFAHIQRTPKVASFVDNACPAWQMKICRFLVDSQKKDGSWNESPASYQLPAPIQTSLALIFLSQFREKTGYQVIDATPE